MPVRLCLVVAGQREGFGFTVEGHRGDRGGLDRGPVDHGLLPRQNLCVASVSPKKEKGPNPWDTG